MTATFLVDGHGGSQDPEEAVTKNRMSRRRRSRAGQPIAPWNQACWRRLLVTLPSLLPRGDPRPLGTVF